MINPEVAEQALRSYEEKRQALNKKSLFIYPIVALIPAVAFIGSLINGTADGGFILPTILAAILAAGIYFFTLHKPYDLIKGEMKATVLGQFMSDYHPDIQYHYTPNKRNVKPIVRSSGLVRADQYYEEDVLQGKLKDASFYISEIHLKQKSGKSSVTKFRGLLFHLTIPSKNFPKAQIQSKKGFLAELFGGFKQREEGSFWYETQDEEAFHRELKTLFPFIRHLVKQHGDVRINTQGNSMTLMLESEMKFLDSPKRSLKSSFIDPAYYDEVGIQLNTLLFIAESFANDLETSEIEKRLELKVLEYAEQYVNKEA